jgi:ABC-type molybdate transport system substrate-binding protein
VSYYIQFSVKPLPHQYSRDWYRKNVFAWPKLYPTGVAAQEAIEHLKPFKNIEATAMRGRIVSCSVKRTKKHAKTNANFG